MRKGLKWIKVKGSSLQGCLVYQMSTRQDNSWGMLVFIGYLSMTSLRLPKHSVLCH